MSWPRFIKKPAQPSPEVEARHMLGFALREYRIQAYLKDLNDAPLWSTRLRLPKLGKTVFVELTPSLALRIRDRETGRVMTQSMPADFETLDMTAEYLEEAFLTWQATRETSPVVHTPEQPGDDA